MTATRRLAAILAADVVGYSRLLGEDSACGARNDVLCGGCEYTPRGTFARAIDRIGVIPYKLRVY
jgi:hypothetical protein